MQPTRPLSRKVALGFSEAQGSALVIVLGLLAVLMLMAMAFAIAMRTERGGASNQRHAVIARQMLDTALTRVLGDLDVELGAEPTAPWMAYASSNGQSSATYQRAGVLSHEAAAHLPPDQLQAALRVSPGWLPITGDVKSGTDADPIVGRYAYVVLNNTGYLDANFVGADTNRLCGTSAAEIRLWEDTAYKPSSLGDKTGLWALEKIADAEKFAKSRKTKHGRYEGGGEFMRLTPKTRSDGTANADGSLRVTYSSGNGAAFSTNSFATSSFALEAFGAHTPGSVTTENPYGVRPRKFHISPGSLDSYKDELGDRTVAAFTNAFADALAASAPNMTPCSVAPSGTGIRYANVAAAALLDYCDADVLPGRNAAGVEYAKVDNVTWSDRPCTEPVPMFSHFLFYQDPATRRKEVAYRANPANPGSPIVAYTNTFPLIMDTRTVFLNWTTPDAVKDQNFDVSFTVEDVRVEEPDGSTPFGSKPLALASLKTAANAWIDNLKGTYQHKPPARQASGQAGEGKPLTFGIPATEYPLPDKFTLIVDVAALIEFKGSEIQMVPGASFQTSKMPLSIAVVLEPKVLLDTVDKEVFAGWAYVSDPRFAYETGNGQGFVWVTSMLDFGGSGLEAWHNKLVHGEYEFVNPYMEYLLSSNVTAAACVDALDWPDSIWSRTTQRDSPLLSALTMCANRYPTSVGELGFLPLAPLRTISLFDGTHPVSNRSVPRHRVLDWFTVHAPRTTTKDKVGEAHKTAELDGRVNLNPPFTAAWTANKKALLTDGVNLEPLTAVLAGLPMNELTSNVADRKPLPWPGAVVLANAFINDNLMRNADIPNGGRNFDGVAYDLSILGRSAQAVGNTWDRLVMTMYAGSVTDNEKGPRCDFEREGLIRNSVELLTTRQQIFTILLRADAFTPKFGFDDAAQGTTLSTAHAIAEIWRDPEPDRDGMGNPIWVKDDKGKEITRDGSQSPTAPKLAQHSWYIRFLRQF